MFLFLVFITGLLEWWEMKQGNHEGEWQNLTQIFIWNSRKDIQYGPAIFFHNKIQINHVMFNEPVDHA